MLPKKWVIKDSDGNAINIILADEAFVSANYTNYEPMFSDEELETQRIEDRKQQERAWRDAELARTDALILLSDYPYKDALTAYRQELRDWPSQDGWPDLDRPTMGA